jgi:hypothetical protein
VGIHLAKASTGSHLVGIHLVGIHLMGMSLVGAFNERASYAPGFCNKKPNCIKGVHLDGKQRTRRSTREQIIWLAAWTMHLL